jgi:predicted ATPase
VGKTRLSIQVGGEITDLYKDGVWFVELAPLSDPEQVPSATARALGMIIDTSGSMMDVLSIYIRCHDLFVVLDNCEHLRGACADMVDTLLRNCPALKVLVTSREPLGVVGEMVYRVPSLSYPEKGLLAAVESLLEYPAVGLLVDRVRLLLPDYQVTEKNAVALARICQQLNGIPLALELAAARFGVLTAEQVADRLEDALRLLTSGRRTALPRHQTLRAAIDWSYNLLEAKERLLLRRLPAFAGGFTLEAAEAVCRGEGLEHSEILDLLTALVNKSLVVANRKQGEETRYQLLETVRLYALEKLLAAGESEWLNRRHCDYYVLLAEQAEPRLISAERITWTQKLIREEHNLDQAMEWAFSHGDPHAGLRIIAALIRFYASCGCSPSVQEWAHKGLALAREDPTFPLMNLVKLSDDLDERISLCQLIGPSADALLSYHLGCKLYYVNMALSDSAAVRKYSEQCLEVVARLKPEDVWYKGWAYVFIALAYSNTLKEFQIAKQYAFEGWRCLQQAGDRWMVTHLFVLGQVAEHEGDMDRARQYYSEAIPIFQEVADWDGVSQALNFLLFLELSQGDAERAVSYSRDLVRNPYSIGKYNNSSLSYSYVGISEVMHSQTLSSAGRTDNLKRAARLFGAAEALGLPATTIFQDRREKYVTRALDLLRSQLDPDELAAAWAEGAAMSEDEVYRYALE